MSTKQHYTNLSSTILKMLGELFANGYYDSFTGNCTYRFTNFETLKDGFKYTCAACRDGRKEQGEILNGRCPLCNLTDPHLPKPLTKVQWIDWSNRFVIIPNAYPYMQNHINFISRNHETQDIIRESKTLKDLFKFYNELGKKKWVLFFNHLIGNSLNHFHFHATTNTNIHLLNQVIEKTKKSVKRVQIVNLTPCFKSIVVLDPTIKIINSIIGRIHLNEFLNICWFDRYFIIFLRAFSTVDTIANTLGSTELAGFIMTCDLEKLENSIKSCKYAFLPIERVKQIIKGL